MTYYKVFAAFIQAYSLICLVTCVNFGFSKEYKSDIMKVARNFSEK